MISRGIGNATVASDARAMFNCKYRSPTTDAGLLIGDVVKPVGICICEPYATTLADVFKSGFTRKQKNKNPKRTSHAVATGNELVRVVPKI